MLHRRYVTIYHNAAASTQENADTQITTIDSPAPAGRTLIGIYCGGNTAGLAVQLYKNGQLVSSWDTTLFSPAGGFIPLNEEYSRNIEFAVRFNNTTVGAVNNIPVTLAYEAQS